MENLILQLQTLLDEIEHEELGLTSVKLNSSCSISSNNVCSCNINFSITHY